MHRQMSCHARFQEPDQFGVHELIVIRYIETYNALAAERTTEALLNLAPVNPLHDDDAIRPFDEIIGQRLLCVIVGAGRRDLNILSSREKLLSRWTSQPILTAYEEIALDWPAPTIIGQSYPIIRWLPYVEDKISGSSSLSTRTSPQLRQRHAFIFRVRGKIRDSLRIRDPLPRLMNTSSVPRRLGSAL